MENQVRRWLKHKRRIWVKRRNGGLVVCPYRKKGQRGKITPYLLESDVQNELDGIWELREQVRTAEKWVKETMKENDILTRRLAAASALFKKSAIVGQELTGLVENKGGGYKHVDVLLDDG